MAFVVFLRQDSVLSVVVTPYLSKFVCLIFSLMASFLLGAVTPKFSSNVSCRVLTIIFTSSSDLFFHALLFFWFISEIFETFFTPYFLRFVMVLFSKSSLL